MYNTDILVIDIKNLYIVNCRVQTVKIMTVCEDFNVVCIVICKLFQKILIEIFELHAC